MIAVEISAVLTEGLIFGLVAIAIFIAFNWLRFPDLTPDGSFVIGATTYAFAVNLGVRPVGGLILSILAGCLAGVFTAFTNRVAKVPAVVAGLLVSVILYSVSWLILRKPNQFITGADTLIGDHTFATASFYYVTLLLLLSTLLILLFARFASTVWGLRIRAMGDNPMLPIDMRYSGTWSTVLGLGLANGIVGLAGSLFAQRNYSADINMGVGITVTGLAGMILGVALSGGTRRMWFILTSIVVGAVIYKSAIYLILKLGLPAETFRLVSGTLLILVFLAFRLPSIDFIRRIKWN